MLDIAEGVNYLHTLRPSIIHGDIKGVGRTGIVGLHLTILTTHFKVNILITQSGRACLADFGLAAAKSTESMAVTTAVITRTAGTLRWQAPELLEDDSGRNSWESDIYAYACTCYEVRLNMLGVCMFLIAFQIFSGEVPFHNIVKDYGVIRAVMRGDRPLRPSDDRSRVRGLSSETWNVIETCWAQKPGRRLSADQIVKRLRSLTYIDKRAHDNFDPAFPSRTLYSRAEHPFATLADTMYVR